MKYERPLKENWNAKWIWQKEKKRSKNIWLCFNKKVNINSVPQKLIADIAAENKYQLFVNGEIVVLEGGLKRGPTPTGIYYDEVDIAPYLKTGENLISVLVWYWGKKVSYSSTDAGMGGLLFEAENEDISIISDSSWHVLKNPAFRKDKGKLQPNYRLPESNVYYDAREEISDWNKPGYDFSAWKNASEYEQGGKGVWGETYKRDIPFFKDFGLKDYENSADYVNKSFSKKQKITLKEPYNAQLTPYLEVNAKSGKKIVITTENTRLESIHATYVTKDGYQKFESPAWFNGERVTYEIPKGVEIISLKYRESGYNTEFCGEFVCDNEDMNSLWQKSLRTLYVTLRDNFMDCPDRERAQWWGDGTNEMFMAMYCLDSSFCHLYRKGISTMISFINPETKVMPTVVPIKNDFFELPMQQLAGICGFWTYYIYTGDADAIKYVYKSSIDYLNLWQIDENGIVMHKKGSWDWFDWGDKIDEPILENAWYYYALSNAKTMAEFLGDNAQAEIFSEKMAKIRAAYESFWTGEGYRSKDYKGYDDRGNAIAVLSGLCDKERYGKIKELLFSVRNSSPYMEYYVLEALCFMGEFSLAKKRMCERYKEMIYEDYSTLWENWNKNWGTMNHAWTGGPLVIMSKYFAGIKPLAAGWKKFEVRPEYGLQENISCTVPAAIGEIRFEYRTVNGKLHITLNCPSDSQAELYAPEDSVVTVNGTEIKEYSYPIIIK